eukprot:GILK01008800.1.p1 GENE.GILK01008800.1~~GILK01008800.1.p1  ORF type:complete len:936 (+),score=99.64 GILK01008800.1:110-2917(+)
MAMQAGVSGVDVVTFVSGDGECRMVLPVEVAYQSPSISMMLSSGYRESVEGVVHFPTFSARVLQILVDYLRHLHLSISAARGQVHPVTVPSFMLPVELAVEVLVETAYLELPGLANLCAERIAEHFSSMDSFEGLPDSLVEHILTRLDCFGLRHAELLLQKEGRELSHGGVDSCWNKLFEASHERIADREGGLCTRSARSHCLQALLESTVSRHVRLKKNADDPEELSLLMSTISLTANQIDAFVLRNSQLPNRILKLLLSSLTSVSRLDLSSNTIRSATGTLIAKVFRKYKDGRHSTEEKQFTVTGLNLSQTNLTSDGIRSIATALRTSLETCPAALPPLPQHIHSAYTPSVSPRKSNLLNVFNALAGSSVDLDGKLPPVLGLGSAKGSHINNFSKQNSLDSNHLGSPSFHTSTLSAMLSPRYAIAESVVQSPHSVMLNCIRQQTKQAGACLKSGFGQVDLSSIASNERLPYIRHNQFVQQVEKSMYRKQSLPKALAPPAMRSSKSNDVQNLVTPRKPSTVEMKSHTVLCRDLKPSPSPPRNKTAPNGKPISADCYLNMSDNPLGDVAIKALSETAIYNVWRLYHLDLSHNQVGETGACSLADALRSPNCCLTSLGLAHTGIKGTGLRALALAISSNENLVALDFTGNTYIAPMGGMLSNCGDTMGEMLIKNQSLTTVNLSMNSFKVQGGVAFASALERNKVLYQLDLSHTQWSDRGVSELATCLSKNEVLQDLSLAWNRFSPKLTAELLGGVTGAGSNLRCVNLSHSNFDLNGAAILGEALRTNCTLETLLLQAQEEGSSFRAEGCVAICSGLAYNRSLTHLNLDCQNIRNTGCLALCRALKNGSHLRKMSLRNNLIGEGGALAVAETLEQLNTESARQKPFEVDLTQNPVGAVADMAFESLRSQGHQIMVQSSCNVTWIGKKEQKQECMNSS